MTISLKMISSRSQFFGQVISQSFITETKETWAKEQGADNWRQDDARLGNTPSCEENFYHFSSDRAWNVIGQSSKARRPIEHYWLEGLHRSGHNRILRRLQMIMLSRSVFWICNAHSHSTSHVLGFHDPDRVGRLDLVMMSTYRDWCKWTMIRRRGGGQHSRP